MRPADSAAAEPSSLLSCEASSLDITARDVSEDSRALSSGSRSPRKRGDCLTFHDDGNRNRRNVGNCSSKDTTSQPRIMGSAVRISNVARWNRLTYSEQTKCCAKNSFLYSPWVFCLFQDQDNDGRSHISVSKRDFVCTSSAVIAWHQLSQLRV